MLSRIVLNFPILIAMCQNSSRFTLLLTIAPISLLNLNHSSGSVMESLCIFSIYFKFRYNKCHFLSCTISDVWQIYIICNHNHNQDPEESHYGHSLMLSNPPSNINAWTNADRFFIPLVFIFTEWCRSGIRQNIVFKVCLYSPGIKHLRVLHIIGCMYQYIIPLSCWLILHCFNVPHFVYTYQLKNIWVTSTFAGTMNKDAINIHMQFFMGTYIFISIE